MGQSLKDFISTKITDPRLRDEVLAELRWRGMDRDHGLIFEDSIEELDTPTRHPRPGMRVQLRHNRLDKRRFEVRFVDGQAVTVAPLRPADNRGGWELDPDAADETFAMKDLMTVVTHVDKVFPGLTQTGSAGAATAAPSHISTLR